MKKQLIRATATAVLAAGLTAGFAGLAAADINTSGPNSKNAEKSSVSTQVRVENQNNLSAGNNNSQNSKTGSAKTDDNTTGGDANSGAANNDNSFSASATVDNSGVDGGSMMGANSDPADLGDISNTGPQSSNTISSDVKTDVSVVNTNDLKVTNSNYQTAATGNATVSDNTTGGSATSGDASNSTSSSVTFDVTN